MEFMSFSCPNCGANLNVDPNTETCFCSYCGANLQKSDPNTFTIKYVETVNYNETVNRIQTDRFVDEAKVMKEQTKQLKLQDKQQKRADRPKRALIGVWIFLIIIFAIRTVNNFINIIPLLLIIGIGIVAKYYFSRHTIEDLVATIRDMIASLKE